MTHSDTPFVFLPGAGNYAPDFAALRAGADDETRFEVIRYPGWHRLANGKFSADALIDEIAGEIAARVPHGPIRIVGLSIGGHFGYAAALKLQALGREIAGFCAIDSFMIQSEARTPGWKGRAAAEAWGLIRHGRVRGLVAFVRSRFWRALLRVGGGRLTRLLRKFSSTGSRSASKAIDPVLETELSMRLLIRETAPWLATLDHDPTVLIAPTALLRTSRTAGDDPAWRRRCPNMNILEVSGNHSSLFEAANAASLRQAFLSATGSWPSPRVADRSDTCGSTPRLQFTHGAG